MPTTKSTRILTAVLASTAMILATVLASPAVALMKIKCDVGVRSGADVAVAVAEIDPIVYHRVDSADSTIAQPHQHDLFANKASFSGGNATTYQDAVGKPTLCRTPGDTAGYWTPSMVYKAGHPKAGQRVPVKQLTAYYRGFASQTTHAGSEAIPAGARLVAEDDKGYGLVGWTCGQNSTVTGGQQTIPDCSGEDGTPGNTLTAHINFPSCWNGKAPGHPGDPGMENVADTEYGNTSDNADFVYPTNKTSCPTSHPREVVQLRETIQYAYTGTGTDVELTSDHGAAPGSSMHADFWNTWNQAAFVDTVQRCVRTAAESNCAP